MLHYVLDFSHMALFLMVTFLMIKTQMTVCHWIIGVIWFCMIGGLNGRDDLFHRVIYHQIVTSNHLDKM